MKYLLDTNICIYLIKRKSPEIIHELEKVGFENVYLSTITVAELEYGVANSCRQQEAQVALLEFMLSFTVLDFTQSSANCYGRIRKELKDKGEPIGEMDMLIASIALANNLTIVTNNEREFTRISNLHVTNWKNKS